MEPALAQAEESAEEEPVRLFTSFDYQAKSWNHPQRILYKAEVTQGKANPRFVTTNIRDRTPKLLYEKVYCARGRAEGFIKNHKTFLHSDRTSCHRFAANQFRLFLHSAAAVLMHAIQQIGLQGTPWATATFDPTISRKTKGVLCSNPTTYRLKRGPAIRYRCKTWTRQAHEHGKGPGALKTSRASRST
jgi:hypothetical protein